MSLLLARGPGLLYTSTCESCCAGFAAVLRVRVDAGMYCLCKLLCLLLVMCLACVLTMHYTDVRSAFESGRSCFLLLLLRHACARRCTHAVPVEAAVPPLLLLLRVGVGCAVVAMLCVLRVSCVVVPRLRVLVCVSYVLQCL